MPATVLTVGGSDSGGGAGIQADIKAFSALGVHGTSVITAVTAQNTVGVDAVYGMAPDAVAAQLDSVLGDFEVSWAKTGMLFSPETIYVVAENVERSGISLVLDPVFRAEAGGRLLMKSALKALEEDLLPLATVVTPNVFEAGDLSGRKVVDLDSAIAAGEDILAMGPEAVVITGGHMDCTDVLVRDGEVHLLEGSREKGGNHGVGCTYSAALTAHLARGLHLVEAASSAQTFAAAAVSKSYPVGKGAGPVNQAGTLLEEADRYRVISELEKAVETLLGEPGLGDLIPEVGMNIGMAIDGASGPEDVAAVVGRMVRSGRRVTRTGPVLFGSSRHISRVILSAMRYDPKVRSAMNIRLGEDVLCACEDLELGIASFDRREEPPGTKTMSWGTARAVEGRGSVPDVIWDPGGHGKEPMVRLLGVGATQVAEMAVEIAKLTVNRKL